jgi:tRNA pseudouridine38-40 synthase
MYRYQILIEYVGTSFIGWQKQSKGRSIQKLIQTKLSNILKQKVKIYGSGRTDAGVHAIEQSAHFDTNQEIENLDKFLKSINFFLNKKLISIKKIKKRNFKFHARFSAKQRIYKYIIFNRSSEPSIERNRGWYIRKKLDLKEMKKGATILLGKNDYSTFRSSSCNAKSPIRSIEAIKINKKGDKIQIQFKSRSFLKQQVRSMVGCLKYIGEGKWKPQKIKFIIGSKNRKLCAPPAPPEGLYLEKVIY